MESCVIIDDVGEGRDHHSDLIDSDLIDPGRLGEPPQGGMKATSPGDITLASYESAAHLYRANLLPPWPPLLAFLDRLAVLVGSGRVLELGSGPGRDAIYLESRGLQVIRTDASRRFVKIMHAEGHEAQLLDVRYDDLGGPYDAVFANAVLLHLSREEFRDVLERSRRAVVDGGVLAFTLKQGEGEAWSNAKLDVPRHFTYWRESEVLAALGSTTWTLRSIEHVKGRTDDWLYVMAHANQSGPRHAR